MAPVPERNRPNARLLASGRIPGAAASRTSRDGRKSARKIDGALGAAIGDAESGMALGDRGRPDLAVARHRRRRIGSVLAV
jgi:hypothetical protein